MVALSLWNLISALLALGVLIGLLMAVRRLEPHWASRDGLRFISTAQHIDRHGLTNGRPGEYRFSIEMNGDIQAMRRVMIGYRPRTLWRVEARSDQPPNRREVFVLRSLDDPGAVLAVGLPERSRAVTALNSLLSGADPTPLKDPD